MLASCASAVANGLPDNASLAMLLFCSSVNYWRHPVLGWRRNLDMVCAVGSLAYQVFYTSTKATDEVRMAYCTTVAAGCSCYAVSRTFTFYFAAKPQWGQVAFNVSSAAHVGLHLFGNLGNVLLYDALGYNWLQWRMKKDRGGDER